MKSKFSIQIHHQKKKRSIHWDLRILAPNKSYLLSFAIPKKKFPEKGEKVLAIRTINHKVSYMDFSGFLSNGDSVEIYDKGDCYIAKWSKDLIVCRFNGKKIKDTFVLVRMKHSKQDDWLILRSSKEKLKDV